MHRKESRDPYFIFPYKGKVLKLSHPRFSYLYFKNIRINLLTGEDEEIGISFLFQHWKKMNFFKKYSYPRVFHLYYELGYLFNNLDLVNESDPLVYDFEFEKIEDLKLLEEKAITIKEIKGPSFKDYEQAFLKGREELLKGNCYQFNLTFPFKFSFQNDPSPEQFAALLFKTKSVGVYGGITSIPLLNRYLVSNSPECLFQITQNESELKLVSMPIKGTIKYAEEKDFRRAWRRLNTDKKNRGELNMITDLMRNDLSRIERPNSKVLSSSSPLRVPGILHQYSKIECRPTKNISYYKILQSLFPGGSVTGAPKKRVMEILNSLEKGPRGFYCGSTLIAWSDFMAASINIRSCEVDLESKTLSYHSGGGITLLSKAWSEFQEMRLKVASFTGLFDRK